jgi:predicted nucleic acid-binding protein
VSAVDTSVVVAALAQWHEAHELARPAARDAEIPLHALVESYAVLTRLPAPYRVRTEVARQLLEAWFPADKVLNPPPEFAAGFLGRLVDAGISGGASYDALVGLTAATYGVELTSRDRRATTTYGRLGVRFRLLGEARPE